MNTLYPGLVGNFFIFSLVYSLVLFWLVHKSHMVPIFLLTQCYWLSALQMLLSQFSNFLGACPVTTEQTNRC